MISHSKVGFIKLQFCVTHTIGQAITFKERHPERLLLKEWVDKIFQSNLSTSDVSLIDTITAIITINNEIQMIQYIVSFIHYAEN